MSYSVTDQSILSEVQTVLMEPINGGTSMGTTLWTTTELISYLNDCQRQIIRETGVVAALITVPVLAGEHRISLPDTVISIRRATWMDSVVGTIKELDRSDPWVLDHMRGSWGVNLDLPTCYLESAVPNAQIEIAPAPLNAGILQLVVISTQTDLSNSGIYCSVPDEFTPYLKYGVLASCFKKPSPAQDLIRAQYCEERLQEGIDLGRALMGHGGPNA